MARWMVLLLALLAAFCPALVRAQDAECAEVKIVIEQKVSLERQAFDAHMVIRNGLDSGALSNIKIELTYLDQDQQPVVATADPSAVGATFFQRIDQLSGLASPEGSDSLPAKSTADIHWLIIPSQGAGGDTANGRLYYIGAKVTYTLNGQTTTVDVTPDYVIVRPQPLLVLDYFLPTDVYGDDPFTPQTEPPVPFTLGVRILNVGAGTSVNTQIESAQPQIVENRQGLLIDFTILGGYVGNQPQGKSLLLDFGDIPGQQARVGRWIMQTTLSGQFIAFNASYSHADSLGGAVTSLIQEVRTHKLVHDVLIDLAGHDDIPDFLAEAGAGVRVFDSLGGDVEVIDASRQASLAGVSGGKLRLTFPVAPNLVYAKVGDPFQGAKTLVRVVRSDGKVLPAQNYWLSKTRNADLSWSYFVQIFDSNTTGDYVLEFSQGATAALSGMAYQDANGNGIRDAGEAAQSNLPVTLKGVDEQGRNVLVTAYTDAGGGFGFTDLAPGRYRLEAASVSGWVDGMWAAGSAGGTVQPGAITDIVLTAGTVAQGYWIAKRLPVPGLDSETGTADLSIALQAARSQLRGGETTAIVVTVRNAGEGRAQAVTAQVAVPSGLTLNSSATSRGSYAGGVWAIGDLDKSQEAQLTLTVQAGPANGNQDAGIAWPASVTSQTPDPQLANNSALLGLTVLADKTSPVELTQSLPAYADVLMLVSCPAGETSAGCESAAALQAQARLGSRTHRLTVVSSLAAWREAVRGGAYNLLWLHGGAGKFDDQQLQETRAAVRRGASLVVDGEIAAEPDGNSPTNLLADVLGAQIAWPALGSDQSVDLPNEPGAQATLGALLGLRALADNTYVMARSANGDAPVMVNHPFGQGQGWLSGFDLLQSQNGPAAAFWSDYLDQQIQAITPAGHADPALAGTRLAVRATARSNAADGEPAQDVSLRMDVPVGAAYDAPIPAPTQAQDQQVRWDLHLIPAQSGSGEISLILPQTSAALQLQTSLRDIDGALLGSQSLPIQVLGLDTLVPRIQQALAALSGSTPSTQALIGQARDAAAAAQTAQTAQPSNWDAALAALADLQTKLMQLAPPSHDPGLDPLALDVARWMGLAQSRWQATGHPDAIQVLAQSGMDQRARVNTAFAAPLTVRVADAQGLPVAGVMVHFQLPADGASAQFAGGVQTADAGTDTGGLAVSPVLTANGMPGSYNATASVAGAAQTATFALTNLPQDSNPPPATLRLISGSAQTAKVGTAFAAPIVAQVLDAQGQPVQGASVKIAFAASGASAAFPNGQRSVTLTADGQGRVTSPVFTANNVLGAHQADLTVAGVAGALAVGLANVAQAPTLTLQPIQGNNQSAPAGQAYGLGIMVRVVDAQNKPKPGATVLFSLPASGPSASFGGGRIVVSAVTGADGVALSPVPVANRVQGSFQALAVTEGAAQPLPLSFTNLPPSGSGKQFKGAVVTGTGVMTATLTGGGETCVFNPRATRLISPDGILTPDRKFQLPYGLFDFELVGCDPGSEVTISTTWPDLRGVTGYLKHGQTPASANRPIWYAPDNLRIQGNTVTYTVRDGGRGDDDLAADGAIHDPSGPVKGDPTPDRENLAAPQAVPALGTWASMLLALILGLTCARGLRRQR